MTVDAPHLTPPLSAGIPEPGHDLKSAPMPELEEELGYRIKLLAYRILDPEKKSGMAAPALDPDDLGSMGFPAASIGPNSARYLRTKDPGLTHTRTGG